MNGGGAILHQVFMVGTTGCRHSGTDTRNNDAIASSGTPSHPGTAVRVEADSRRHRQHGAYPPRVGARKARRATGGGAGCPRLRPVSWGRVPGAWPARAVAPSARSQACASKRPRSEPAGRPHAGATDCSQNRLTPRIRFLRHPNAKCRRPRGHRHSVSDIVITTYPERATGLEPATSSLGTGKKPMTR